jgi:DNA-directed RNA polymerase I and III subunit RPAC2
MAEIPTASSQVEPQEPIMDLDDEVALEVDDKVELLKGYEPDLSAATFCLHDEDHTLGNALRYMLMKK